MKKITITKVSVQKRIASLIESEVRGAVSIFSTMPQVTRENKDTKEYYQTIVVKPENMMKILTFAEIDNIREAVEKFAKKYHGIKYYIDSRSYLASDNETWLSMPVFEINVRRYDTDIFNVE